MEHYFDASNEAGLGYGGQICQNEWESPSEQALKAGWRTHHEEALKKIGGKYQPNKLKDRFGEERVCAMRLAGYHFFKVRT